MTPRNLVPATPMRFTGQARDNSPALVAQPTVSSTTNRVKKSSLPPGYVDRAAQRREGLNNKDEFPLIDSEQVQTDKTEASCHVQKKMEFLDVNEKQLGFPKCSQIGTENVMKLILGGSFDDSKKFIAKKTSDFSSSVLRFSSISECKTQAFDPYYRPKKVFRMQSKDSSTKDSHEDNEEIIKIVREAMERLTNSLQKHSKYLETLKGSTTSSSNDVDIFPSVGRFDENSIGDELEGTTSSKLPDKTSKAKSRLFAAKKKTELVAVDKPSAKEEDVFDLIAQKSGNPEEKLPLESHSEGGLFGFSDILPKLSRLEGSATAKNPLTGVYASILHDGEEEQSEDATTTTDSSKKPQQIDYDNEETSLYPGYLEKEFSDDEEEEQEMQRPSKGGASTNKRKLKLKEEKDAVKVEKLVKSKFGIDL